MIRYFVSHPTIANLLMLIFLALGLLTLPGLRRETLPDFAAQEVEVSVLYPGASAAEIENAICLRIEDAVDAVSFIEEVRSSAREGIGTVVIKMQENADFPRFFSDIKTEVEAIDDFPEEAEKAVIRQLGRTDLVIALAVSGDMSPPHLKIYCEQLKSELRQLEEISQVEVLGFSEHEIRIEIPNEVLRQYGISMADIAATIAQQSVDLPLGTIETRYQDILLRFADERHSPQEFADLVVVAAGSGAEIRLGDIARISDRFTKDEQKALMGKFEYRAGQIYFNGHRAGLLRLTKTKTEDALTMVQAARKFVAEKRRTAPPGVEFVFTQDISSVVKDRLQLLLNNGRQGLVLVFLTMWLFFSLRFSFWVAMGLPVSFLGALFCFSYIGYTLNMITMVGLLLALGLLMDDAIVISENIASHLAKGKAPLEATIDGLSEVSAGVLASFLTTVCVFGPLAFIEGNMGKVLRVMPVVLILVLSVSLIEAFLILPHHLAHSLQAGDSSQPGRIRQRINALIEWLRERVLGVVVDAATRCSYLVCGLIVMLFLIALAFIPGGLVKFQPFPDIDGDVVLVRVLLPQGTPLTRTEAVVAQLLEALKQVDQRFSPQPGGKKLIQTVNIQYGQNQDAQEEGPHLVSIYVDLLKAEKRRARIDDILAVWRAKTGVVQDAIHLKFTQPVIGPAGLAIDLRISGSDLVQLKRASLDMQQWLANFIGVQDLSDDLRPGKPEVQIRLQSGAMTLGITARTVAAQLRAAFYGKKAAEVQVGSESYEINIRLPLADRDSLSRLEYFHITMASGQLVPLTAVATLEHQRGYARIARINGRRTITIQGDVDTRKANAAEIIAKLRRDYLPEFRRKFPGLQLSLEGQSKESSKTGFSLLRGFIIGVLGIFVLLSFQFKSYSEPAIVMVAIPFALIGVIFGHWLLGITLCMPSILGFVSLAGVVVNDSILLVEFIKLRRREGQAAAQAAANASRERFRAVALTSLTTIAGLIPLLLEKSLQAQILIPLAVSIVFGLMASTVLVLLVVPCLYKIFDDLGWTASIDMRSDAAREQKGKPNG